MMSKVTTSIAWSAYDVVTVGTSGKKVTIAAQIMFLVIARYIPLFSPMEGYMGGGAPLTFSVASPQCSTNRMKIIQHGT